MQKVYRLLRNNQQTGPYSIDEIVQLGLKPFDLIWVEGKSGGWAYPSEIDSLKNYVPKVAQASNNKKKYAPPVEVEPKKQLPKNIFISMPANMPRGFNEEKPDHSNLQDTPRISIEEKAEALRKRAQEYLTSQTTEPQTLTTNYTRSITDVEEDYTSWVYKTKTKKKKITAKQTATIVLIIGILGISAFGINTYFNTNNNLNTLLTANNNLSKKVAETNVESNINEGVETIEPNTPVKKEKPSHKNKTIENQEVKNLNTSINSDNVSLPEEPANEEKTEPYLEKEEPVITQTTEPKKKTFKETINDLFKKKKKDEPTGDEGVVITNGERKARKRGEEIADKNETVGTAEITDITSSVEARLNTPENWMMGIKGLKVTLYNRSSAALKNALVEVWYYNEQNSLIEKKTLQFNDIAAGKSKTIAAPDHRLADHADVKVISAKGTDVAYAKN